MDENPWQHWSEMVKFTLFVRLSCIHGWKSMATLKHKFLESKSSIWESTYPWMKIHGNIEAVRSWQPSNTALLVSMDENPWQHWSWQPYEPEHHLSYGIHGWKSMATLKRIQWNGRDLSDTSVSMDENPWQLMPAATIAVIIVVILAVVHIF